MEKNPNLLALPYCKVAQRHKLDKKEAYNRSFCSLFEGFLGDAQGKLSIGD